MLITQNTCKTVNMCSAVNNSILINDIYLYKVKVSLHFLSIVHWNTLLLMRVINGTGELFSEFFFYSTVRLDTHGPMFLTEICMHSEYTG